MRISNLERSFEISMGVTVSSLQIWCRAWISAWVPPRSRESQKAGAEACEKFRRGTQKQISSHISTSCPAIVDLHLANRGVCNHAMHMRGWKQPSMLTFLREPPKASGGQNLVFLSHFKVEMGSAPGVSLEWRLLIAIKCARRGTPFVETELGF